MAGTVAEKHKGAEPFFRGSTPANWFLLCSCPYISPLFMASLYHKGKRCVKRCGVSSLGFISLSREKRVPTVCYCALRHHFGFEKTSKKLSFSTLVSSLGKRKESGRELRSDSFWSEWRDLNSRPLDPQSSALPTAPHPDMHFLRFRLKPLEYSITCRHILQA